MNPDTQKLSRLSDNEAFRLYTPAERVTNYDPGIYPVVLGEAVSLCRRIFLRKDWWASKYIINALGHFLLFS